jgi:hypothetical protein
MQTAAECHQYARESVRWAARAKTEEQRRGFLEIGRAWREAAFLPYALCALNREDAP